MTEHSVSWTPHSLLRAHKESGQNRKQYLYESCLSLQASEARLTAGSSSCIRLVYLALYLSLFLGALTFFNEQCSESGLISILASIRVFFFFYSRFFK